MVLAVIIIPVSALTLYVVPAVPIVTALVTKLSAPGWLKVGVTAVLAAAVAAVTTAVNGGHDLILNWRFVGTCAIAFAEAMGSYLVLRKPIVDPVAARTADLGLNA